MKPAETAGLTIVSFTVLASIVSLVVDRVLGEPIGPVGAMLLGFGFGFLYGLESGLLLVYNLSRPMGWLKLVADATWSLPNTVFGFVLGNAVYIFFGKPSKSTSKNSGFIAFKPRGSGTFGNSVLQTLGTVNLGGAGQHELLHVLQARLLGPLYLPVFAVNYAVNFIVQVLWTFTIGGLLYLARVRRKPYFSPPSKSAVGGFFGWIYYSNLLELWAYASGNP